MADILVRDVPQELLDSLKERAARNGRSLQREVMLILDGTLKEEARRRAALAAADEIRNRLAATGRTFSNSVDDLREDRAR
ncbi:MAG: Arc family DNA-binding protein [Chloroflexota bacterium]|nr:Arc family DNA-binding protein [Chloroflexota bacterium]